MSTSADRIIYSPGFALKMLLERKGCTPCPAIMGKPIGVVSVGKDGRILSGTRELGAVSPPCDTSDAEAGEIRRRWVKQLRSA